MIILYAIAAVIILALFALVVLFFRAIAAGDREDQRLYDEVWRHKRHDPVHPFGGDDL